MRLIRRSSVGPCAEPAGLAASPLASSWPSCGYPAGGGGGGERGRRREGRRQRKQREEEAKKRGKRGREGGGVRKDGKGEKKKEEGPGSKSESVNHSQFRWLACSHSSLSSWRT